MDSRETCLSTLPMVRRHMNGSPADGWSIRCEGCDCGAGVEAMPQLSKGWRPVEQKGQEEPVEV